ncbi:MAG: flagellar hook-associated protein FlgK [Bdellovibrionota bacterium]
MAKINQLLDTGRRALSNSQTGIATVAHNIANKSTEGYSRQRVELVANQPVGEGQLRIGTGAKASQVTRTNNPWLEKQIQKEDTLTGFQDSRSQSLARVEQIYNEQQNKGLNQYMTDFFNGFRELSNNPESLASRTMVKESASALTKDFGRVNEQLRGVQNDLDGQIQVSVGEINQAAKEIASLNEKILGVEVQGNVANDERDRRDLMIKKLGEKVDITWAEGKDGMVSITAGNTAILVSGMSSNELIAKTTGERDRTEVFFKNSENGTLFQITNNFTGGKLGGCLEVRDKTIEEFVAKNDELAYNLAKEVNSLHIEGYDRYGKKGVLFFEQPESVKGASQKIKVNNTVLNDVGRIAAGEKAFAPGDNTVSNMISSLQHRATMRDGSATFDDFYSTQVGEVGALAQRAQKAFEAQKNIKEQMSNIRESISGVSLDEETTKMIEMQKSYEASARVIKVADEMFDTILSLKRM